MFTRTLLASAIGFAALTSPAHAGDCHNPDKSSSTVSADAPGNILDVAASAGQFKTLAAALSAAGFEESLSSDSEYTVFAPTDAAFAKLGKAKLDELLKPENRQTLRSILRYHIVKGRVSATDAVKAGAAKTRQGGEIEFSIRDGQLTVNKSNIVKTDIAASNGVIHVIDTVLLPS